MKNIILISILISLQLNAWSQNVNRVKKPEMLRQMVRKEIRIPDIEGFKTLKCDLHMHTIFSDGAVWPAVRVQEAFMEGLDVIAITDHIERHPSKKFVGGDDNSAYDLAVPEAEKYNILLVKAAEITRAMPPGHLNALFIQDANKLDVPDYMDAIAEANRQGAFVFWNHPGWDAQQPDTTIWWDVHEDLYKKGWMHGIEVFNWDEYYPVAFGWCNEKDLAYIGNTDMHQVAVYEFNLSRFLRPMTLVFSTGRTLPEMKDALFSNRTVALFGDEMAGPENLLKQLFEASVEVRKPFRTVKDQAYFEISNPTDLTFSLKNNAPAFGAPQSIELLPGSTVIVSCKPENGKAILPYEVVNLHTGKESKLKVELVVSN
jgi:3',5'-nucleoside bisphosphate phosphatase